VKGRTIEWKSSKFARSVPKDLKPRRNKLRRYNDLSIKEKRLIKFSKSECPKFEETTEREGGGVIYL
jgi:hypothetical protein